MLLSPNTDFSIYFALNRAQWRFEEKDMELDRGVGGRP